MAWPSKMGNLRPPRDWHTLSLRGRHPLLHRRTPRAAAPRARRRAAPASPRGGSAGSTPATDGEAAQRSRVAAALFVFREPITSRKLADAADLVDGTRARTLAAAVAQRLQRRGAAFTPVEVAGGLLLMTSPRLADWLGRSLGGGDDPGLSPPALETLAVVAYRQPVLRAEVEAVRGVQCGEILRMLMERDFLRIVGRSEELGRPLLYGTTRKFLQVFGLRRLEDLPPIDQTRSSSAGETPAA